MWTKINEIMLNNQNLKNLFQFDLNQLLNQFSVHSLSLFLTYQRLLYSPSVLRTESAWFLSEFDQRSWQPVERKRGREKKIESQRVRERELEREIERERRDQNWEVKQ